MESREPARPGQQGRAPWATPTEGGRLRARRDAPPWEFASPEPDDFAAFDWRAAAGRCRGRREGIGPSVTLARLCRHPGSQGRPIGLLPHGGRDFRLVYLLQWSDVPVAGNGPAPGPGKVPVRQTGSYTYIMDAISGERLREQVTNSADPWPSPHPRTSP